MFVSFKVSFIGVASVVKFRGSGESICNECVLGVIGDSCMCKCECGSCVVIGDMDVSNVMCVVELLSVGGGVLAVSCCRGVCGGEGLRLKRSRLRIRSCLRLHSRRQGGVVEAGACVVCSSLGVVGELGGVGDIGTAGTAQSSSVRVEVVGVYRSEGICAGSAHCVSFSCGSGVWLVS